MEIDNLLYTIGTEELLPDFKPFGSGDMTMQRVDDFIQKSEEIAKQIIPLSPKNKEDENIRLSESVGRKIKDLRNSISESVGTKTDKIISIIGQMYNGVLVKEKITLRKGKIFRYRSHSEYSMGLTEFKKLVLKNLHEVSEKLTERNLEILEYVLDKVDNEDEKKDFKELRFDEIQLLDIDEDWRKRQTLEVVKVNGVRVNNEGDIYFIKGKPPLIDDISEVVLSIRLFNMLYYKFQNQIELMCKEYIEKLEAKEKEILDEIEKIKKKGSALLMVAEIQSGEDNVKGFGN